MAFWVSVFSPLASRANLLVSPSSLPDFLNLLMFSLLLKTSQELMNSSSSSFGLLNIQIAWVLILLPTLASDFNKLHDLLEPLVSCL